MVFNTVHEDRDLAAGGGYVKEQVVVSKTVRIETDAGEPMRVTSFQTGIVMGKGAGTMKETQVKTRYTTEEQPLAATDSASDRLLGQMAQTNATRTFQSITNKTVTTGLTLYRPTPDDF